MTLEFTYKGIIGILETGTLEKSAVYPPDRTKNMWLFSCRENYSHPLKSYFKMTDEEAKNFCNNQEEISRAIYAVERKQPLDYQINEFHHSKFLKSELTEAELEEFINMVTSDDFCKDFEYNSNLFDYNWQYVNLDNLADSLIEYLDYSSEIKDLLEEITEDDIADILSGDIDDWEDLSEEAQKQAIQERFPLILIEREEEKKQAIQEWEDSIRYHVESYLDDIEKTYGETGCTSYELSRFVTKSGHEEDISYNIVAVHFDDDYRPIAVERDGDIFWGEVDDYINCTKYFFIF